MANLVVGSLALGCLLFGADALARCACRDRDLIEIVGKQAEACARKK